MQVNHLPLAGRLRHCLINWEKITTDSWVLETVRGLRLNFVSPPVQTVFPQEASLSGDDRSLVTLEIQELLQKGANSPGSPVTRDSGVSQFPLFSSKKRRWSETCSKLEAPKPIPSLRALQNGRNSYGERPSKKRRFHDQDRSQRRIFHSPPLPGTSKVCEIQLGGHPLRVCLPPLWSVHCP